MSVETKYDQPTDARHPGLRTSEVEGTNPKDLIGQYKVDLTLIPPVALIHMSLAQLDGAVKYGEYNWREYPIQARGYIAAGIRHFYKWLEGEDVDPRTGASHLGHVMACCAIVLDAQHMGTLIDNRVKPGSKISEAFDYGADILKERITEMKAIREQQVLGADNED